MKIRAMMGMIQPRHRRVASSTMTRSRAPARVAMGVMTPRRSEIMETSLRAMKTAAQMPMMRRMSRMREKISKAFTSANFLPKKCSWRGFASRTMVMPKARWKPR